MRDAGTVVVDSTCKLAPVKPADAMLFFGKQRGRRVAVEHDPRQAGLFDNGQQQGRPTVVPMRAEGSAGKEEGK